MADLQKHEIDTPNCRKLIAYVQGDLSKVEQRAVFLTVHDLGCNHMSWVQFLEHPVMKEARDRSIVVHVVAPGQDDKADDLQGTFPTLQQIAEDLPSVLDKLGVTMVIGLGEGAGANILARFGMAAPSRVMGLVLVHCTGSTAGFMEHFKEKFMNWKISGGSSSSAEQYLILHKFGNNVVEEIEAAENKERLIKEYHERLQSKINQKNLKKYVEAFMKRSDFNDKLESKLVVETLLVTGAKASHNNAVHQMHQACNKAKASLLKLDDIGDVLTEGPEKLAQSLILFCKGLGVLTSVPLSGVERQRTFSGSSGGKAGLVRQRTMSMEEADTPNLRRFSFSSMSPGN